MIGSLFRRIFSGMLQSASSANKSAESATEPGSARTLEEVVDVAEPLAGVGWVVVLDGVHKGRDFKLFNGQNRVGTDADMEVVLTDPYVSSHHATIVFTDEGLYRMADAGSTNGTMVNGKRVMQTQIVDNDTLRFGRTLLRFKALG